MIRKMAKVLILGQMEINMLEIGLMVIELAKVLELLPMEINMREILLIIKQGYTKGFPMA